MAFGESFTGKGVATVLPPNKALEAQQGLNATVLQAEELKYKVYKENRDEFLKNMKIDPAFVISKADREYIARRIDQFNHKWSATLQKRNNVFTTQDRMDIQTDHDLIEVEKQEKMAQYELWKTHRDMMNKDMGANLSAESFVQLTDKMMSGGGYNATVYDLLKPADFGKAVYDIAVKIPNKIPALNEKGIAMRSIGGGQQVEDYYTTTEEEAKGILAMVFADNPRARKDALQKWNVEDKAKYDYNINNWLWDKYNTRARPMLTGTRVTIPGQSKKTSAFNWNIGIGADNNRNNQFDMQGGRIVPTVYGDVSVSDFMPISAVNPATIYMTINKAIKFDETGRKSEEILGKTEEKPQGQSDTVSVEVLGYSPSEDLLFVQVKTDGEVLSEGETIALNASEYNQYLSGRPFGIDRKSLLQKRGTTQGTFVTKSAGNITQPKPEGYLNNLGK
jgi:hypothetical protein